MNFRTLPQIAIIGLRLETYHKLKCKSFIRHLHREKSYAQNPNWPIQSSRIKRATDKETLRRSRT